MVARRITLDLLKEFVCKCGDCRFSCCCDWEVRLSREEFQAARSRQLPAALHQQAVKNLRLNPNRQNDDEYALCRMRSDGHCSFLTGEGLCGWRLQSGEPLCVSCDNFPFTFIAYAEDQYVFPSLACEAVGELLMRRDEPIRLEFQEQAPTRSQFNARIETGRFARRPLLANYPQLIAWSLTLLQNRRYALDDRMVLLAHAMSLIDWLERNQRVAEVPDAMDKFLQAEKLEESLRAYQQHAIGPQALLAVNAHLLLPFVDHATARQAARRTMQGLGIEFESAPAGSSQPYRLRQIDIRNYRERKLALAEWMQAKERFLEHVVVCEFLRGLQPFSAPSVWDGFLLFNAWYAVLKGTMVGNFAEAPGDEEMIDSIQQLFRFFVHHYDVNALTSERLQSLQLTNLHSAVALAKG